MKTLRGSQNTDTLQGLENHYREARALKDLGLSCCRTGLLLATQDRVWGFLLASLDSSGSNTDLRPLSQLQSHGGELIWKKLPSLFWRCCGGTLEHAALVPWLEAS